MNGDGQLDLVVSHRDFSTLSVVPGRADGSFAAPEEFHHSYRGLVDFVAADFDGDGHTDLFSTQSASVNFVTLWGATVAANRPPIADAGPDQVVAYSDQGEIGVGATASSDPDGHALKFTWRDASGNPLEGEANGHIAYPPWHEPGTYTYTLTADDLHGGVSTDTVTIAVRPDIVPDIVLYAADAREWADRWFQMDDDPTAAAGLHFWYPDAGAPKRAAPLDDYPDYVALSFHAEAGKPYRLWVRGKAENNYWSNDSLWVQFSSSVTASGQPVYRIGTTSGTPVVIENCSGCGLSGWGWQDNGYGTGVLGPLIHFGHTGEQSLLIQVHEDGVAFDQIVLSSEKYLKTAPGATTNDATIVPK
jgi:hypothetical protein